VFIAVSLSVTDSNHVESTTVLFPHINHCRFWETSCFTLANSDWPSLRRSVQLVPLMVTVLLLLSYRGRQRWCLFSSQRNQSHSWSLGSHAADDLVINTVVGCHYFSPGLWLPFYPRNITIHYTAMWQRFKCEYLAQSHCETVDNFSVMTDAALYSLFMLVQLASTITISQHPTHE